jgi:hypothetical protein
MGRSRRWDSGVGYFVCWVQRKKRPLKLELWCLKKCFKETWSGMRDRSFFVVVGHWLGQNRLQS